MYLSVAHCICVRFCKKAIIINCMWVTEGIDWYEICKCQVKMSLPAICTRFEREIYYLCHNSEMMSTPFRLSVCLLSVYFLSALSWLSVCSLSICLTFVRLFTIFCLYVCSFCCMFVSFLRASCMKSSICCLPTSVVG